MTIMMSDELSRAWGRDERMCRRELDVYLNVLLYVSSVASFQFKCQAAEVVNSENRRDRYDLEALNKYERQFCLFR